MRRGWHRTSRRIYIFLWKVAWDSSIRYRFFEHKRIISPVKGAEFVSDRMSYIILRGHWCDIFVLNVHAPTEDKIDDMKDSFYEESERVTIHGFRNDDRIYWTLWYRPWPHARTHTTVHSIVFTSHRSVVASNGGRSPSSAFPNYPWPQLLASHSNSSQRLNFSSSLTNSRTQSLTNQLT
jgi:hypothetical protein